MVDSQAEDIWSGRLHLGDSPGVHGDATYVGLSASLPVELMPFPGDNAAPSVAFVLHAEGVSAPGARRGHEVLAVGFKENDGGGWLEKPLGDPVYLNGQSVTFSIRGDVPRYVALKVAVDTGVAPGLYDDLILTRLQLVSPSHYADFGFRLAV